MPTLPLYSETLTAGGAEGWRHVRAPGGYELWRFIAADPARDLWAIASLSWGSTASTDDFRRYRRYRRRPTRYLPPIPQENCSASFALLESGKQIAGFDTHIAGEQFSISPGELRLGDNNLLTTDTQGHLHLHLHGKQDGEPQQITVDLVLEPREMPTLPEIELTSSQSPVHRLSLTRPICKASCEISISPQSAPAPAQVSFHGNGCYEHAWGIRPPAWDFRWRFSGYIFDERGTMRFECLAPRGAAPLARLLEITSTEASDHQLQADLIAWRRIGLTRRKYPARAAFGDHLILENPLPLAVSPRDVHLTCEARGSEGAGTAICRFTSLSR